MNIVITCNLCW